MFLKINTIYQKASEERHQNDKPKAWLSFSGSKTYTLAESQTQNLNSLNDRVATLLNLNEDDMRRKISTGETIIFQNELTDVFKQYLDEVG